MLARIFDGAVFIFYLIQTSSLVLHNVHNYLSCFLVFLNCRLVQFLDFLGFLILASPPALGIQSIQSAFKLLLRS